MPELPEVETIKVGLQKYLVGHTIEDVEVRLAKQVQGDTSRIVGQKVTGVERYGKGLVIELANGYVLAIHIKLTGQLVYRGPDMPQYIHPSSTKVGEVPNKWTHVIFTLDKGAVLYYNDLRQFGWIKILPKEELKTLPFFKELGPEPLKDLTEETFGTILSKAKTPIKPLLMDQTKMGGIGNIYANDSLYLAKINPKRPANSLTDREVKELYKAILAVLKKGLEQGGASELTFVNVLGEEGHYQDHALVYGKEAQKCPRDNHTIEKYMLAGRGTYWCPACQH